MLQTLDEIKKVEMSIGSVINGVDNANLMSVDSTAPIKTGVDKPAEESKEEEVKQEEKKIETSTVTKSEEKKEVVEAKKVEDKKSDADKTKEEEKKKESEAVRKRIDELTKKMRTFERERNFERAKRLELEAQLQKAKSQVPSTDKPKRSDFEDDEAYMEALTDWKVDQKFNQVKETAVSAAKTDEEKEVVTTLYDRLDEVISSGREKHEDFDKVALDKSLIVSESMLSVIVESDMADDIFYYLGKNPSESATIAELTPAKAAIEIGKLELKILKLADDAKAEAEKLEAEKKKKESQQQKQAQKLGDLPEPITPIKTTGATEKDPNQMSPKEYRQWRESKKG